MPLPVALAVRNNPSRFVGSPTRRHPRLCADALQVDVDKPGARVGSACCEQTKGEYSPNRCSGVASPHAFVLEVASDADTTRATREVKRTADTRTAAPAQRCVRQTRIAAASGGAGCAFARERQSTDAEKIVRRPISCRNDVPACHYARWHRITTACSTARSPTRPMPRPCSDVRCPRHSRPRSNGAH